VSHQSGEKQQRVGKQIKDLLPRVLDQIGKKLHGENDLVLSVWPEIVGAAIAPMARAVNFQGGVLLVEVANSTLYSILAVRDRARILQALRKALPAVNIRALRVKLAAMER